MIKYLLIGSFFVFSLVNAADLSIKGQVVNSEDNSPLPNATIIVGNPALSFATGDEGRFEFKLPADTAEQDIKITVSHVGYTSLKDYKLNPAEFNLIKLSPSLSNLNQITVTANRFDKEAYKVSQPITLTTKQEIRSKGYTIASDAIRNFPGIDMNDAGPFRTRPVIRGLFGTRILVLLDGDRLNDQRDISSFAGASMSLVDVNEIDRIEVVNGPASVLYGSDAMGGVINIISTKNHFSKDLVPIARYSGRYTTTDEQYSNRFDIGFSGKNLTGSVGYMYRETGFDYAPPNGWNNKPEYAVFRPAFYDSLNKATGKNFSDSRMVNSQARVYNFNGRLAYKVSNKYRLDLDMGLFRGSDIGYPGVPNDSTPFLFSYPNHDRNNFALSLTGDKISDKLARLSARMYYEKISKDFLTDFLGYTIIAGPPPNPPTITLLSSLNYTEVTKLGLNFQELYTLRENTDFTFGFDYFNERIDGQVTSKTHYDGFGPQPFDSTEVGSSVPKNSWNSLGMYISSDLQFDPLSVTAGLRYDNFWVNTKTTPGYTDTSGALLPIANDHYGAINGSLGIVYALSRKVNLVSNIGTAYRVPNVVERFYYGSASNQETRPNPNIKPERSVTVDFGVKATHDWINYSIIGFYSDYSDFSQLQKFDSVAGHSPGSYTPLWRYENIEHVVIYGLESIIEANLSSGFYGNLSVSYQHGQNETIGQPLFVSPAEASLTSGYRHKKHGLFGEFTVNWAGDQKRVPDVAYLDDVPSIGYTVLDAAAGIDVWSNVKLSIVANNIFDEVYAEPFNSRNPDNPIVEPGRNFVFCINASL
jgi:hemoglobin/transferrin/lactoferrin receptor protein